MEYNIMYNFLFIGVSARIFSGGIAISIPKVEGIFNISEGSHKT